MIIPEMVSFRAERRAHKIRIYEVSERAGVCSETIINLEKGKYPNPGILTIRKIQMALRHLVEEKSEVKYGR